MTGYGLPSGTQIFYGAKGFPQWVYDLAGAFGLQASTYPGHQCGNRAESGYAPNPSGLNRGIDWTGSVASMQRFAEYLLTVKDSLEQVIWENPETGSRVGVAGGQDVSRSSYFASDFSGHRDHVHTRQSKPIPLPGAAAVQKPSRRPAFDETPIWSNNTSPRHGTKVDLFILHTQEGGDGDAAALARWMNNNQVSYHYTVSTGRQRVSVIDVVDTDLASWSVLSANPRSINLCFAGSRASWKRADWLANRNSIEVAAYLAVQDCRKYGIPTTVIAPPYVRGAGITDHNYVTEVLKDGSHTDVGRGFPWDVFLEYVTLYADETPSTPTIPATPGGFLMALTEAEQRELLDLARKQSGILRVSRSPVRRLGEGPTQTITGFEWSTDGSVHLLLVELLASLGHPPTLSLLNEVANADPTAYPDRQEDRKIAQAILNKLQMNQAASTPVVYQQLPPAPAPAPAVAPAPAAVEAAPPAAPAPAAPAGDGNLFGDMNELRGQIHQITESLAALSNSFLGRK